LGDEGISDKKILTQWLYSKKKVTAIISSTAISVSD